MQTHNIQIITTHNIEKLQPYLERFGDSCLAFTGLQENLEHFFIEGIGYITYLSYKHITLTPRGTKIAMSNPVCAQEHSELLIKQFINTFSRIIFIQISRKIAILLDRLGHPVNQFGIETELNITNYNLKGKTKSSLRQWRNKCIREQVEVKEIDLAQCNNIDEIKSLSTTWLKRKGGKQLQFLNRPFVYEKEQRTRCFTATHNGKLIGLAVFDPFYKDNKVYGYYHNIDQIAHDAPNGVSPYIILEAMDIFRDEGVKVLSLGMSPLHQLGAEFSFNKVTRKVLRWSYKNLNSLYPFIGNFSHKKKFAGEQKRVYFCSTTGNRLWEMYILMKAIRIF